MEENINNEQLKIQNRLEKRKQVIHIIFLLLMLVAVSGLIIATVKIVQYHDMLSNPLGYSLKQLGVDSCTCLKDNKPFFVEALNYTGD